MQCFGTSLNKVIISGAPYWYIKGRLSHLDSDLHSGKLKKSWKAQQGNYTHPYPPSIIKSACALDLDRPSVNNHFSHIPLL